MSERPVQPTGGLWDDERLVDAYRALTARPAPSELTEATLAATTLAADREGHGWRVRVWPTWRGPRAALAGSAAALGLVAAVVLAAGVLLVATSGPAKPGSGAPTQGTALSAEWKIADSGITLTPPGNAAPTISSDSAYGLCLSGVAACGPGNPTAVQLALATDTGSGQPDPSGKLIRLMDNRLVWAISWLGIRCPPSSGGAYVRPSPSSTNTPVATTQPLCDQVAFVDAHSGAFIFTYTGPHQ